MQNMHIIEIGGRWGAVFAFEDAKDAMKAYEVLQGCKQVSMEFVSGEYLAVMGKQGTVCLKAERTMTQEEYEQARAEEAAKKAAQEAEKQEE